MASATNWLSFSLSPIEMLRSSQSHQLLPSAASAAAHQHSYFVDSFYGNDWGSPRAQALFTGDENHQASIADCGAVDGGYSNPHETQNHQHPTVPKLEDFLGGGDGSLVRYSESQTDPQEDSSSLTHIYDNGGSYFGDHHHHHHHDLKAIAAAAAAANAGFQAFPANSGSEVDDSMPISRAQSQMACGDFVGPSMEMESAVREMVAVSQCPTEGLSLGVNNNTTISINNYKKSCLEEKAIVAAVDQNLDTSKRIADTFGQRTSIYRGVTRHRWTGRYEAHLWDNSCRREGQARKGRQVYLGGYDKEDKAARAYDLAALKYWGPTATTNFPISNYSKEVEEMKHVTKQEFIASLRRKSSGFSRGASIYRGVTRHHQQGRWQARIGRVAGNKDLYLGTFATEEEAAEAYDIAAIKFRGMNAVTNFEMNRYDVEAIANSALPIGGAAKRLKLSLESEQKLSLTHEPQSQCSSNNFNNNISFASGVQPLNTIPSGIPFDAATAAFYHHQNLYQHHLHSNSMSTASDSPTSASSIAAATSPLMTLLPPQPEFFIWPHQSY